MMKQLVKKYSLPVGLFTLSAAILLQHYTKLSDFTVGLLFGISIGLIVIPTLAKFMSRK